MQTESDRSHSEQEPAFPIPDRIPVFPLPNVVFFPKTYLPLHIFEPRYREMIADTTVRGQCIGMALLKEGWEQNYDANPPMFDVGCVGRIVSMQRLPDGRSNILLQGLRRYEIREQFYDKPYREARVTLKEEESDISLDPAVRASRRDSGQPSVRGPGVHAARKTVPARSRNPPAARSPVERPDSVHVT